VTPRYCGDVRITDNDTLRIVKEEAGFARCEIESALSRGFKGESVRPTLRPTPSPARVINDSDVRI
jgi:acetylglutamate kinase